MKTLLRTFAPGAVLVVIVAALVAVLRANPAPSADHNATERPRAGAGVRVQGDEIPAGSRVRAQGDKPAEASRVRKNGDRRREPAAVTLCGGCGVELHAARPVLVARPVFLETRHGWRGDYQPHPHAETYRRIPNQPIFAGVDFSRLPLDCGDRCGRGCRH